MQSVRELQRLLGISLCAHCGSWRALRYSCKESGSAEGAMERKGHRGVANFADNICRSGELCEVENILTRDFSITNCVI